jgi:hypothetical protein
MKGIPPAKKMALAHSTRSTDRGTPGNRSARYRATTKPIELTLTAKARVSRSCSPKCSQ